MGQGLNRATEVATRLGLMDEKHGPIGRELVLALMSERDIEVLGVLYALIMQQSQRINPPLDFDEIFEFVVKYYTRCFKENPPKIGWASTNYTAGWDLVNWFSLLFKDKSIPRSYLAKLKDWMGELYKTGDEELRTCLVTATFEHLFEQKKIQRFFHDWKNDPDLKVAYDQGMQWVKSGARTPLGKPKWFRKASSTLRQG